MGDLRFRLSAYCTVAVLAPLSFSLGWALRSQPPEPVPPPRVGSASTLGAAEGFILRGVKGLSPKEPEILWVDPNSGQGISESFLFTKEDGETLLEPDARKKVLTVVRENGLVRTEQYCRQVESAKGEWSLGYCVNRLMHDQEPPSSGPTS